MKSTIIGSVVIVLLVITFLVIGSIQISENTRNEIETACVNAITSAQRTVFDKREDVNSNDKYLDIFNKDLKKQLKLEDDKKYSVKVLGIDYKKGLLDVEVVVKYKNLVGQEKEVKVRKTMINEKIRS